MSKAAPWIYEFGPFRLDVGRHLLLRDGKPVPLKPRVFDLLLYLVENTDRLLMKEHLLGELWPDSFVEEGSLTVSIFELRKALGDGESGCRYIETVPRRGYRFVGPIQRKAVTDPDPAPPRSASLARPVFRRSIAVLPFKHIGAQTEDEYLPVGLADALITRLSNVRQIAVRPTSAVRKYANRLEDPIEAGRALKVQSILEGSIQTLENRIRVTVQLVNVEDGSSLWADKFDDEFTNIFQLEDFVSENVTRALTVIMNADEKEALARIHTANSEAYRAYLRGRYLWNKRTPEALMGAIKCFEDAAGKDPEYALAYCGLADCYFYVASYHVLPPKEAFLKSKQAALKALQLDQTLSEAHASVGHLLVSEWDWAASEAELRRAIELAPNNSVARHFYSIFLRVNRRFDEAIEQIKIAAEIDPVSLSIGLGMPAILFYSGRYDEGIAHLKKTLDLHPDFPNAHTYLGAIYEVKGMYEEAIAEYEKKLASFTDDPEALAYLAHAFAMSGRTTEALDLRDRLERLSSQGLIYSSSYYLAIISMGLNDFDEAFSRLWQAYSDREESLALLRVEPRLDPVRSDPRFHELLSRVGFNCEG